MQVNNMPAMDPQMPQDAGQQEPGGRQLAVPDGSPVMPANIVSGTANAFRGNNAYKYQKRQIGNETIYVCEKGNEWAREGEFLVLRCYGGIWIAFDTAVSADRLRLLCRQPVFRCSENITQPGWHDWEPNGVASPGDFGVPAPDWQGTLSANTLVP